MIKALINGKDIDPDFEFLFDDACSCCRGNAEAGYISDVFVELSWSGNRLVAKTFETDKVKLGAVMASIEMDFNETLCNNDTSLITATYKKHDISTGGVFFTVEFYWKPETTVRVSKIEYDKLTETAKDVRAATAKLLHAKGCANMPSAEETPEQTLETLLGSLDELSELMLSIDDDIQEFVEHAVWDTEAD